MKKNAEIPGGGAELNSVRDRYQRLIEGLKGEYFFYQHGLDGVFTYVSPSIRNVLGYSQKNFLTHYTSYLTDDPVNREVVRLTELSLRGLPQPPYRVEIFHKDGSRRWLEVLDVPLTDACGRVTSVEGIAHDITERVKVQAELDKYRAGLETLVEERTAELNAVFERAPVLMLLLDEQLKVVRTNATARDSRLIGKVLACATAWSGFCGAGRDCRSCPVRRAVAATMRSGKAIAKREVRLDNAGGRRYFLLSTKTIKTRSARRLLLCLDDITPQKEAEEALRAAEKTKDFLTQTIVHDLKTPLASVILAGQLLEAEGRGSSAAQRDTLEMLNCQAREMERMVSDMLDISRIEAGKLRLKTDRFDPERLLRAAADSLRIAAAQDKKSIVVKTGAALSVGGDRELLRRVLENLLGNALKFSPAGGQVVAGVRPAAGGWAQFYVKDSGPGIPVEHHARIFDKYVQLDDIAAKKIGGKGMGLAFCKLAVEAHGGSIRVESAPGAGSTFSFSIPPGLPGKKKLV